jgi:hypothetical protein
VPMKNFGKRLKRALDQSPLSSQSALAVKLDVRPSTVTAWVLGDALPEGKHMIRLPGLLRVSGHWLLTGEQPMAVATGSELLRLEVVGVVTEGRLDDATLRRILETAEPPQPDDPDYLSLGPTLPLSGPLQEEADRRAADAARSTQGPDEPHDGPSEPSSGPRAPRHTEPGNRRAGGGGPGR